MGHSTNKWQKWVSSKQDKNLKRKRLMQCVRPCSKVIWKNKKRIKLLFFRHSEKWLEPGY